MPVWLYDAHHLPQGLYFGGMLLFFAIVFISSISAEQKALSLQNWRLLLGISSMILNLRLERNGNSIFRSFNKDCREKVNGS